MTGNDKQSLAERQIGVSTNVSRASRYRSTDTVEAGLLAIASPRQMN
jgi:hypothetical protein